MKIGIVGLGIVGRACQAGFEHCNYTVFVHDINLNTTIQDVLDTDIVYVCVPTDKDASIVENVVHSLKQHNYQGVIAIKSTVPPGTTQKLIDQYDNRIVFVPEFLKERSAEYDFIHNHKLCLIGANSIIPFDVVKRSHNGLPDRVQKLTPTEAELVKYYHNTFNAMRIVFANTWFDICQTLDADYDRVKESFVEVNGVPDEYLDVEPGFRGYAGACLPKDVLAMHELCKQLDLPNELFNDIDKENKLFDTTVFVGMRS